MTKNKIHAMKFKPLSFSKNTIVQCGKTMDLKFTTSEMGKVTCLKCLQNMRIIIKYDIDSLYPVIDRINKRISEVKQ